MHVRLALRSLPILAGAVALLLAFLVQPPLRSQSVTGTLTVGNAPLGVGFNPLTGLVYVSNSEDGTVSVIRGSQVQGTIAVGNGPNGIDADTSANLVYVANFSDATVSVINGATNTVVSLPAVGNGPFGVAYLPGTAFTFVTNSQDGTISWLQNGTVQGTASLPNGGFPYGIAADPAHNRVLIANFSLNRIEVFEASTMSFGPAWSGNGLAGPYGIAVDSATGNVYVANSNGTTVSVFTSAGSPVGSPIAVGNEPRWVASYSGVSPSHIFVSNRLSGTVSVIAGTSVVATIPVGVGPIGIGVNAATGTVYVANTGLFDTPSNAVTVIQDAPPATPTSTATATRTPTPTSTPTATPTATATPFPTPQILGITPVAKPEGAPGFTLKIVGSGFVSDTVTSLESTARWNGADRTTLYISPTLLYADILTLDLAVAGIANVTVLNPEAGLSNAAPFTVQSPTPTPTSTSTSTPTPTATATSTPVNTPTPDADRHTAALPDADLDEHHNPVANGDRHPDEHAQPRSGDHCHRARVGSGRHRTSDARGDGDELYRRAAHARGVVGRAVERSKPAHPSDQQHAALRPAWPRAVRRRRNLQRDSLQPRQPVRRRDIQRRALHCGPAAADCHANRDSDALANPDAGAK